MGDSDNGSRNGSEDSWGWWKSRTGLEQKLIIVSTLLFVLSFCLIISVAVIDNRNKKSGHSPPATPETTITAIVTTEEPNLTFTETVIVDNTTNADNSSSEESTTSEVESQTNVTAEGTVPTEGSSNNGITTDEGTVPTKGSSGNGTATDNVVESTTVANATDAKGNEEEKEDDGEDKSGKDEEKEKANDDEDKGKDNKNTAKDESRNGGGV